MDFDHMNIVDVKYIDSLFLLAYLFDNGAKLFYGRGVLPGTDVETYRFVNSSGFPSKEDYKEGKSQANIHSRSLGFKGTQGHFESFYGKIMV